MTRLTLCFSRASHFTYSFGTLQSHPNKAKQFLKSLLKKVESERLGYDMNFDALLGHPWFSDVDWEAVETKQVTAPWCPTVASEGPPLAV